jgi:hypothetical protein
MKFTIEVDDFYLDSEDDLSGSLKEYIKRELVSQMWKKTEEKVARAMEEHLKDVIALEMKTRVQILMDNFLASGKVKHSHYKEEIPVSQHISENFAARNADIVKQIDIQVRAQVNELVRRYDILFATQILAKVNEKGFLKEDVARLLLTEEGKG